MASAGKYWILTEPKEEKIKRCVSIYEKSVGGSGTQILNEITYRGDKNGLPEFARNKLLKLEKDSESKSNYIPKFSPKKKHSKKQKIIKTVRDKISKSAIIIIVISIPILAVIGFIQVIKWIF